MSVRRNKWNEGRIGIRRRPPPKPRVKTLDDLNALAWRLDCEENAGNVYNAIRDSDPVRAARWLDTARGWRDSLRFNLEHYGIDTEGLV